MLGSTLKDPAREQGVLRARVAIAVSMMLVAALAVTVRIANLQIVRHEDFETRSRDNRVKILPVAPNRGLIFDRNGVVLAQNVPTYSLEAIPESVVELEGTIRGLAALLDLSEKDIQSFRTALERYRRFDFASVSAWLCS